MKKKFNRIKSLRYFILFSIGFISGTIVIWPGLTGSDGRKCFYRILKDGIDENVRLGTIISIEPSYLLKIKNAKNKYQKILLVGDYCFRKF